MALYLLNSPTGFFVVRAPNGPRAMALAGVDEADVTLLSVEGQDELLVVVKTEDEPAAERWVEVTSLGDKERTFRNLDNGSIRCEPFAPKAAS